VDISDFSNGKNKKNFELLPAEEFIAREEKSFSGRKKG
jgi:hypothetical protein